MAVAVIAMTGNAYAVDELPGGAKERFLENGKVKIGVDVSSGGAVFWFSESGGKNLMNHADRGRFIQQSYYGREDGSIWGDKPWRWNPVQGGDYKGRAAGALEVTEDVGILHVKSVPVNWAGGEAVDECRMEEWISLEGEVARVKFRFSYQGKESHPEMHQELPAVFVDHALADLVYYQGDAPWTGAAIRKDRPGWPNEGRKTNENWAGFVGADGRGMGVFFPGTGEITTYRYAGPDGPEGGGCSYFAPIRKMTITPGLVFEYEIYLTIGTPEEMRARFGENRDARDHR